MVYFGVLSNVFHGSFGLLIIDSGTDSMNSRRLSVQLLIATALLAATCLNLRSAEIIGVTVTPHVIADSMMYRKPRDPELAAKVQLFVKVVHCPCNSMERLLTNFSSLENGHGTI